MSNSIVQEQFGILEQTMALRAQLMDMLADDDLAFKIQGTNLTLGALCRESGEVEQSYIDSFKTFKQDFNVHADGALETSVEKLKAWYAELDEELRGVLAGLSEADIQGKMVDRGHFSVPVMVQLHIYREALLIFAAKVSVYLKAMEKPLPEQWVYWIG